MGWQGILLPATTTVTSPSTHTFSNPPVGAHSAATFYVDCTDIGAGDTWTVALDLWDTSALRRITVGTATVAGTGMTEVTPAAPFETANYAIPSPIRALVTNTVSGASPTITFAVVAAYGG